ncbi:MAG: YjbF family lipoprotein [Gammaproteobacteria bacterium]|uniref:YjbF family lipoprotein n=1 Tax=Kluyvera sp. CHPC 1.2972 TaxID=2995176 RepID=UPI002FD85450|nr:YjbF family lipoprotein [Gammaproteobacteria bacterium]
MYKKICLASAVILLCACNQQRPGIISDTFKQTFTSQDAVIDNTKVASIPYASMSLTVDDGPLAFIVLAWNEHNTQKWLTADSKMVSTQNGRIIKTIGFQDNLLKLESDKPDPLSSPLSIQEGQQWRVQMQWNSGTFHSATVTSRFHWAGTQNFTILDTSRNYRLLEEHVTAEQDGATYVQRYWVDAQTGKVVHSEQNLHPHGPMWSLTLLKPYS